MAYDSTPSRDSSLGLIFRLNGLWQKVDFPAEKGDYDAWNNILDRIFVNLDFVDEYSPIENEKGKMIDVSLDSDDYKIYKMLSDRVNNARIIYKRTKDKTRNKFIARSRWYDELMKKDRWIRKFMQRQKLYLKITEKTPGSSLFGSFGKGK